LYVGEQLGDAKERIPLSVPHVPLGGADKATLHHPPQTQWTGCLTIHATMSIMNEETPEAGHFSAP
jgi:hypothetical protein